MTPEKTALIPIYREQWRQIGLSIAQIDRPQATAAINTAYKGINPKSKIENPQAPAFIRGIASKI
ncbi:hypothetical protein QUA46_01325 [Microcoleus sp. MON2_D6]|uniref:hypothetical protein n=1 Tax=Microcoleus sp. Z1_A1 TaxID=3055428 RepID=UPI002FD19F80